ncbi:MAG TPA: DUF2142 domain-containing protein [Candidatus Acidoferrales bacterium]|jgi:hypothetical protein|nr:DUF2142 domain-containing protein [Candidatus Acidoferrales bacterium]
MEQAEGSVSDKAGIETADANTPPPTRQDDRKVVSLFCLMAAIHTFVFCAGFPFFNNVDEPMHFDLVLKYSHGHVPRGLEMMSGDSAIYLAIFSSCAYFGTPEKFPGHEMPPPLWTEPAEKMQQDLAANRAGWEKVANFEVSQAPLYYALAGSWWHIGQWLGFQNGRLLYWLRFLNVLIVAGLVGISYVAARIVFPENRFLRLGVPALAAFVPQTAFYSLGNDTLSAFCFGVTFVCLLKWLKGPSVPLAVGAGIAFAATYLSKTTNLPLLAVVFGAMLVKSCCGLKLENWRTVLPAFIAFLFCAAVPFAAWMIWCKSNYGDFTGSAIKIRYLGWTVKPFAQWLEHPIFTAHGFWIFFSENFNTFWQGEFKWLDQPLCLPGTNVVYTIISAVLLAAGLTGLFPRLADATSSQRLVLGLSLASFGASFGFFALMSIIYDFHDCPYPSQAHPYFTSGRLLLGGLIPFLLVSVYGLDLLLKRFSSKIKLFTLAGMISGMFLLEVVTDWRVFSNPFNWFHLP